MTENETDPARAVGFVEQGARIRERAAKSAEMLAVGEEKVEPWPRERDPLTEEVTDVAQRWIDEQRAARRPVSFAPLTEATEKLQRAGIDARRDPRLRQFRRHLFRLRVRYYWPRVLLAIGVLLLIFMLMGIAWIVIDNLDLILDAIDRLTGT